MTYWRSLAAVAICAAITSHSFADLHDGLSAYWDMNGNALDTAGALGSTASATEDNGMIIGDAGSVSFGDGIFGQAAIFDGETGYVSVPTSADLERTAQDLSISAWFRVDTFDTGWQTLISKGEQSAYRIARQGGDTNSIAYAGGSEDLRDSKDVNDGQWHHVVAITDHTNSVASYYVDGQLVQDSNDPARAAYTAGIMENDPPLDLFIGANPETSPPRQWEGGIDDVAIWNRALSVDDVATIYNAGVAGMSLGEVVPEPASGAMIVSGLVMLAGLRRRRR